MYLNIMLIIDYACLLFELNGHNFNFHIITLNRIIS